jgi:hypothetical protein
MEMNPTWLLAHRNDVYSQSGEDGIVGKILELLPDRTGWCVEFGALDGRYLSNTRNLIEQHGYSAVLIEGDRRHFRRLQETYARNPNVVTLNRYVGFGATDNLDRILADTGLPAQYDFLSVDIDGNDYHVWKAAVNHRPRVVCIEFNPTIPTEVRYVQAADPAVSRGSSLLALVELGREKNYELVCVAGVNAFFVSAEYYPLLGIGDNRPATLRTDLADITYIFSGYDGTILLEGCRKLPWHGLSIRPGKIQVLPAFLRRYPGNYNPLQLLLYGVRLLVANPRLFRKRFGRFVRGRFVR